MYGFTTQLTCSYDDAVRQVTEALKAEGFGILTEINVKATLKTKLDVDMPAYIILGACNPPLAHKALIAEPDIGLLLPCNVIVREDGPGKVTVGFLDPQIMVQLVNKPAVIEVAEDAKARLMRVKASLEK